MVDNLKFEVIKKITDTNFKYKDLDKVSKFDSSSPPSVFIGSKLKYPLVNVGILSPLDKDENAWIYDDAKYWADNNFNIREVVKLRDNLLNSRFQSRVTDSRINNKFDFSKLNKKILKELSNNPMTLTELSKELIIGRKILWKYMNKLKERNLVESKSKRTGKGGAHIWRLNKH